jgi:hypothetical protein
MRIPKERAMTIEVDRQSDAARAAVPEHTQVDTRPPDPEDIRVVYQAAMAAYTYEGAQVWSRFNAMLVAHGILIAVIGQLFLDATARAQGFAATLAGLGLLISLLWLSITIRGFGYHDAFLEAAKKQEQRLSAGFLEQTKPKLRGAIGQIGRPRMLWITCGVIAIFMLLYLGLLISLLFS